MSNFTSLLYQVFKIWCVFATNSASQFGLALFQAFTPARGQEQPGLQGRELPWLLLHRWALGQRLIRQAAGNVRDRPEYLLSTP